MLSLATGLGVGYIPFASGTIATFALGIPLCLLFCKLPAGLYVLCLAVLILLSVFLCEAGDRVLGEKDSHKVVIDELCGYLITMAFVPLSLYTIGAGFFLFRFFDITKLQPAKWVEDNLPGGAGVTFDDIVAGMYSNIVLHLSLLLIGAEFFGIKG